MPIRVAISIGDYNGIGPEVILKSLQSYDYKEVTPIILGAGKIIDHYRKEMERPPAYKRIDSLEDLTESEVNLLECLEAEGIELRPGAVSAAAGRCAMRAVERGIELCMERKADALVTAPISKEAVNKAGYAVPGHTEFLAEKTGAKDYMMLLVNEGLRVGLLTTHIPLGRVASELSEARIVRALRIMDRSLRGDFGIEQPRIAVFGLNPHAGDGGTIGNEEQTMIGPAVEAAQSQDIAAEGPFPADGFFGNRSQQRYDGVLAMYHDQGLIPFKTLSFGKGVNFTAGLPIIRTSPDHGTAFDIAGKNLASPDSFRQALALAVELARKRSIQPA